MSQSSYFPMITCKVRCGNEHGNGFLVGKNQIVTAAHTLTKYDTSTKITVTFCEHSGYSEETVQLISDLNSGSPIALLQLSNELDCDIIPLSAHETDEDDSVKAYGYLGIDDYSAERFVFNVSRVANSYSADSEYCNVSLIPINERTKSFGGLSGSALIYDNHIIGMLLRQKGHETTATRVEAITGLKFRDFLRDQGIVLPVVQLTQHNPQAESSQRYTAMPGSVLVKEIDSLLSRQFEPIKQERLKGKYIDSWTMLQEFIGKLPDSASSSEKKAEFYYAGALWAMHDEYPDIAEEYFHNAKKEKPNIDVRTYLAGKLLREGKHTEAQKILQPLDSISVFNLHVACLLSDSAVLPKVCEILSELKANGLAPDSQTHRLISIVAINYDEYNTAHEHIDKAKAISPNNPELMVYEALVLYWEAMHSVFKNVSHFGFAFYTIKRFYPTNEQRQYLERAYSLLDTANDEVQLDTNTKAQIVWGLLLISTLLPGKDPMHWLSRVDEIEILIASGVFYRIDWGIKIPEELYEKFCRAELPVKDTGLHVFALMEAHLAVGKYDKALEVFENYGDEIAHQQGKSRDECELRLLLDSKEYLIARELLNKISLDKNDKERYELIILLHLNPKSVKLITARALALAKKTHNCFDYLNADTICRKFKKWKEATENALNWFKDTKMLYALECQADAMFEDGNYLQALRIIKQAEAIGDLSEQLKICKLNCLVSASQFDDAIKLAKTFGDAQSNPKLVIFQAQSYINNGQKDSAIQMLRSFADDGQFDFELYKLLVELIKRDNPDLAFNYAYRLHLRKPENQDVLAFAGMVGIETGHSDLSEKFYPLMHDGLPNGKIMRMMTLKEGIEILSESRRQIEENATRYSQLEIPIHIFADSLPIKNMGGLICSQWETSASVYARYGGKDYVEFDCKTPIILDYTACITILKLDIFEYVVEMLDSVWIPDNLLAVWLQDMDNLKGIQPYVDERDINLSDELNKLSFTKQPRYEGSIGEYNNVDVINLHCAKENNAYIIDELPLGKSLEQPIPDEWYDYQIYPDELYASLQSMKMPHPEYDAEKVRANSVERLLSDRRIVLDNHELLSLSEANALEMCSSSFSLFIAEETVYAIHYKAQENRNKKKCVEWLEKGYKTISNLCAQKKIRICPVPKGRLREFPESAIYSKMVAKEFKTSEEQGFNIWYDDRYFSGFKQISSKKQNSGLLIGTLDVLRKMRGKRLLSENIFYQIQDKLFEAHYCFFTPDADYLFSRIIITDCDDTGRLIENKQLKAIRIAAAIALHEEYGLNTNMTQHTQHPEMSWYLVANNRTCRKCMSEIWKSSKDYQWKCAASDWILLAFGDMFKGTLNDPVDYTTKWSLKIYLLATSCMHVDEKHASQYSSWLNMYMNTALAYNPTQIDSIALQIAVLISNSGRGETAPANINLDIWEKYNQIAIMRLLERLPDKLLECVLEQPTMIQYSTRFERRWPRYISQSPQLVQSDSSSLRLEDILDCNEDAIENAIIATASSPLEVGQKILDELSNDILGNVNPEMRYRLTRFLFDLSWYLPCELCFRALEKKRYLTLLNSP